MGKALQFKNPALRKRFQAAVAADFVSFEELRKAVEEKLGTEVKYKSFMKVMTGDFSSGPIPETVKKAVAELVGRPVNTLWPKERREAHGDES